MKECFKCNQTKQLSDFYKHPLTKDGYLNKCKECTKVDTRANYSKNREYYREYDLKRGRLDIERILRSRYYGIRSRSEEGYYHSNKYTVTGMPYLSKEEFMKWANENMDKFMELYAPWAASNYQKKLAPSVDRIDNSKGYTKDNLQWLTHGQNSAKYHKENRK